MKTIFRLLFIFLIIIITRAAIGQPWYFNKLYNPNETWAAALSIIGTSNGYFGCAISGDSVSDYFYNSSIFLLDENGEVIGWNNYGLYGFDYYPGYHGSLIQLSNGDYALFGSRHNLSNNHSDGVFFKFNNMGDTIFTQIFSSDSYNNFVGRTCSATFDECFVLLGEVSVNAGYSDVVLIKTDNQANEIWRNQLGTDNDDWGVSIAQTADSGYILGTWAYIPVQIVTADPIVIKTDSQGNFEWSLNLGGPFGDDKAMVCSTQDSCIMVLTAYADSMYTPEHAYTKINLVKIDLEGNIIWNKKYGPSKRVNYISNINNSQNENYIICGHSELPGEYFSIAGWIMEVNSDGDSLWYKDLFYYPPDVDYPYNELYDISNTEDHGFIATGQAFTLDPPNNVQKMWVVKVDSVGCEIPNCWVGIEENDGMEAWEHGGGEAGKQGSMEIWPNPASGVLNVKCLGLSAGMDYSLSVVDIFGREMNKILVPQKESEIQIDVGDFPQGLYVVVLKNRFNIIGSSKLIISR